MGLIHSGAKNAKAHSEGKVRLAVTIKRHEGGTPIKLSAADVVPDTFSIKDLETAFASGESKVSFSGVTENGDKGTLSYNVVGSDDTRFALVHGLLGTADEYEAADAYFQAMRTGGTVGLTAPVETVKDDDGASKPKKNKGKTQKAAGTDRAGVVADALADVKDSNGAGAVS